MKQQKAKAPRRAINPVVKQEFVFDKKLFLRLLCERKSENEIIKALGVPDHKFAFVRRKLFAAIGVENIGGAILYAIKKGIFDLKEFTMEPMPFSVKEKAIIKGTCLGKSDKEIAAQILIGWSAVRVYRANIMRAFENKVSLMLYAIKYGLLEDPPTETVPEKADTTVPHIEEPQAPLVVPMVIEKKNSFTQAENRIMELLCKDKKVDEIATIMRIGSDVVVMLIDNIIEKMKLQVTAEKESAIVAFIRGGKTA